MRLFSLIIFLTVVLSVWTGMHLFVYFRLTHLLQASLRTRSSMKILLVLLALSVVFGRILAGWLKSHFLMEISYIWMGVLATLFFFLLLAMPLNRYKPAWGVPSAWIILVLTALISLAGLVNYALGHRLKQVEVSIPPAVSLDKKIKIVQLSDLHISANTPISWIRCLVDDTLAQQPDLIVITGDIIEEALPRSSPIASEFSRLQAPLGVLAVSGNHEAYAGIAQVEDFVKACGISFLRDERLDLPGPLTVIGFDDDELSRGQGDAMSKREELLSKLDPNRYNILLYHRPTHFKEHVSKGIHLQLSGHTHGGQIIPMNLIVLFYYRYPFGLAQIGESYIYTSVGSGVWGPPMRFPGRSELTVLSLVPR